MFLLSISKYMGAGFFIFVEKLTLGPKLSFKFWNLKFGIREWVDCFKEFSQTDLSQNNCFYVLLTFGSRH